MTFAERTTFTLVMLDRRAFSSLFPVGRFRWVRYFLIAATRSVELPACLGLFLVVLPLFGWSLAAYLPAVLLGFALELSLYKLIKQSCKRPRPCQTLAVENRIAFPDQYSFPSGHTAAAFMIAVLLGLFCSGLLPFLLVWAGLVGLSRIVLGVHYPADVLAGLVLGSVTALAAFVLFGAPL